MRERGGQGHRRRTAHDAEWDLPALADEISFLLMTQVTAEELRTDRADDLAERAVAAAATAPTARARPSSARR